LNLDNGIGITKYLRQNFDMFFKLTTVTTDLVGLYIVKAVTKFKWNNNRNVSRDLEQHLQ
jgi:hypothetical protein